MNSKVILVAAFSAVAQLGYSQNQNIDPSILLGQDNAITTAVPFLAISPDARRAALGDAGVASSPDANSSYWNAAQMAFIDKKYGASLSYTPWLGKIINDMKIAYLTGFYKITQEQTVTASLKYFDLGNIFFKDGANNSLGDFNPREFAFDVNYSRMLTTNFSIGGTARFIHSNLTGAYVGNDAKAASSFSVDLGVYYTKPIEGARNSTLSLGAAVSNIGQKISYTDGNNKNFIPTTLRVGTSYTTELDPNNSITFMVDFSKLLVPSPPIYDSAGNIAYGKDPNRTVLSGMFGSFTDAPDGFKEEIKEIMTSVGIEYWYNKLFAARLGYFNEAKTKGNRKYMTIGLGFRKDRFGIDVAYLVPTNKREHPLAETIRFTLLYQIGETLLDKEDSVTD
jgi:hypothetical protein